MKLLRIVASVLVIGLTAGGSVGQDCQCTVTNQATVVTASGTCTITGQGSVSCFQLALGSVPGSGNAAHGTCNKKVGETWLCGPASGLCTFQPVRLVVTAAACFSQCGAFNGIEPTCIPPTFKLIDHAPWGGLNAGGTANYDVKQAANSSCGVPTVDVLVQFKNEGGQIIFEIRVRYHCAECRANTGG